MRYHALLTLLCGALPMVAADLQPDDGVDDLPALRQAIADSATSGSLLIELPPGRIDLRPERNSIALNISKRNAVTLRGSRAADGTPATTIILHWQDAWQPETKTPGFLRVTDCGPVIVQDLILDHSPLPMGAGTIIASDRGLTVRPLPGHPAMDGMAAFLLGTADAQTGTIITGRHTYDTEQRWQRQDDGSLRVRAGRGEPGQIAYWFAANGGTPSISTRGTASLHLENIVLRSASGFACMLQHTLGDLTARRLILEPVAGRYAVVARDGLHIADVGGAVRIEDCVFAGMQDDAINVHGSYELVRSRQGARSLHLHANRSLRYRYARPGFTGKPPLVAAGDRIAFLDGRALPGFTCRIVAVESHADRSASISVDADLPDWVAADTWIEPLSWLPTSTLIRGNTFRDLVGRGIKLSAHDAVIEDNRFLRTTAPGLHIGGEFDWWESTMPRRVTVRRNLFERNATQQNFIHRAAITIQGKELPKGAMPMGEITIEDNTFREQPYGILAVDGADGVILRRNREEGIAGERIRILKDRGANIRSE